MRYTLLNFILLCTSNLFSQTITGTIGTGIATYAMNSLKNYDKSIVATDFNGLQPSLTDNFPPYIFYQGEVNYKEGKTIYGLSLAHGSTGSRTMYGDYSGKIFRDNLIRYNSIGFRLGEVFIKKKNFTLSANARGSGVFNRLKVKEKLDIYGTSIETTTGYHSVNLGIMPFFSAQYAFNRLVLSMDVGYEYQITGRIFINDEDDVYVVDTNGNEIFIDGRGFRAILNIGYRFNKK